METCYQPFLFHFLNDSSLVHKIKRRKILLIDRLEVGVQFALKYLEGDSLSSHLHPIIID